MGPAVSIRRGRPVSMTGQVRVERDVSVRISRIDSATVSSILFDACKSGNVGLVRILMNDYKADVNVRDSNNNLAIHVAALAGKKEVVLALIMESGYDSKAKCQLGRSLLHCACEGGNVSLVRTLIHDYGAEINEPDTNKDLPIHLAALAGNEEVVLAIIEEFGCDSTVKGQHGSSLLHKACEGGNIHLVQTLMRDYNAKNNELDDNNNLPIHVATLAGNEEIVLFLIKEFGSTVKGQYSSSLLHYACYGGNVSLVRTLIHDYKADINELDSDNDMPIHVATLAGKEEVVLALITEFGCDTKVKGKYDRSLLHNACYGGNVSLVRTLIRDYKADVNALDSNNDFPIHVAALAGKEKVVLVLVKEFGCGTKVKGQYGRSLLHNACNGGNVNLVRTLIRDYKADINELDSNNDLPIHVAALAGNEDVVLALIKEYECDTKVKGHRGTSTLHYACAGGNVSLVRTLIQDYEADIKELDSVNKLPIHVAALAGKEDIVLALIKEFGCDAKVKGQHGRSLLHNACEGGNVSLVRTLIRDFQADANEFDIDNNLPIHVAAFTGKEEVVLALIKEFGCNARVKGQYGRSLLHKACEGGKVSLVRTLMHDYKANTNEVDNDNNLPIHVAAFSGNEEVVLTLIKEFGCDTKVKGQHGSSLLHCACISGKVGLVRTLLHVFKADIYELDSDYDMPIHVAALAGKGEIVLALIKEFGCDTKVKGQHGRSLLHKACEGGEVNLVRTLIHDYEANTKEFDIYYNLSIHVAAFTGKEEIVLALIKEFGFNAKAKGQHGSSLLHCACVSGNVSLIRTLIRDHEADINELDSDNDLPIHVAAFAGKEEVVLVLIKEFGCNTDVKGQYGRSLLHCACIGGNVSLVQTLTCNYEAGSSSSLPDSREQSISPLVTDDDGNTPLHDCTYVGHSECVKALLQVNAPILVKNKKGESPVDLAQGETKEVLVEYLRVKQNFIHADYKLIQKRAKEKSSSAECLSRFFVIGKPGSGKSSLIEALKREGCFDSFQTVSEASAPPHTTGIVPSIHTSKLYGRVLFYDFAGDPKYYSFHAAILESISKSRKGKNLFILVVNMQENVKIVSDILYYWSSFIQHLRSSIVIVGSHFDKATKEEVQVCQSVFSKLVTESTQSVKYFKLNCCKPNSKELGLLQNHIVDIIKDSPRYAFSLPASTLLGVLEKDFSQVSACSVQTILSHIEITGIALPRDPTGLFPVLLELHELGLLFLTQDTATSDLQVVLNVTKLTKEVQTFLFSQEFGQNLNFGILPQNFLPNILPKYITERCLIQLQYCQEIKYSDVSAIGHSSHETFLFFPALCNSDKTDTPLVTRPAELSYSMGWLAHCTDPRDYFPPCFLHMLLLRLVFEFTLSVPTQDKASSTSSNLHLQRRCVMWRTGVHWLMEEGVECLVEMVCGHGIIKGVVVSIQCEKEARMVENCISVFNSILKCVMQAKIEFCHSIKPKFYLLDSPKASNFLNEDHMFAMSDVQRVLAMRKEVILSISGRNKVKCSKIAPLLKFSYWRTLFPIPFSAVLENLEEVVKDLHRLGIFLGIPLSSLEAMEYNFPRDVERQKIKLVGEWLRSTQNLPCWWHLVQALEKIQHRALAEEIREQHGDHIHLQERLLSAEYQDTKPDAQFLEQFAALKEVKWELLASLLSLTGPEIEEVRSKGEGPLAQEDPALLTMKMWATRDEAMYGHLCQLLKTITLFHYT